MSISIYDSKTMPVQISGNVYKCLLAGVMLLILNTKIEQFFVNLTFLLIFT